MWERIVDALEKQTGITFNLNPTYLDPISGEEKEPDNREAITATKFFCDFTGNGEQMDIAGGAITVDIGGGTTDMAIWRKGELVSHSSILFAGRDIFLAPLAKYPGILSEIDPRVPIEELLKTDEKDSAFYAHLDAIISKHGEELIKGLADQPEGKIQGLARNFGDGPLRHRLLCRPADAAGAECGSIQTRPENCDFRGRQRLQDLPLVRPRQTLGAERDSHAIRQCVPHRGGSQKETGRPEARRRCPRGPRSEDYYSAQSEAQIGSGLRLGMPGYSSQSERGFCHVHGGRSVRSGRRRGSRKKRVGQRPNCRGDSQEERAGAADLPLISGSSSIPSTSYRTRKA